MAEASTVRSAPGRASYLDHGRAAFQGSQWQDAFDALREADARGGLSAPDLEALGEAAWWLSKVPESISARERAVSIYMAGRNDAEAATVALELFDTFSARGDGPIASAWLRRAVRILEGDPATPLQARLRMAQARAARAQGDESGELAATRDAIELARGFADADLVAVGCTGEGRILVNRGEVEDGIAILEESVRSASDGEIGLAATGQVYCDAVAACLELGDLRRADEWAAALHSWSGSHPTSVFASLCHLYRAGLLRLRGAWDEAEEEARRAGAGLLEARPAAAAQAFYLVGDIHRVRGDLDRADAEFRRARELRREPEPGLALVRLAQGRPEAAARAVADAIAVEGNRLARVPLLAAQVEIALAAEDLETIRAAAAELTATARDYESVALQAISACAQGAAELTAGEAAQALPLLRVGCEMWQSLACPFEAARARALLGLASRAAGDEAGAEVALNGAGRAFEQLGAVLEAERTAQLAGSTPAVAGADGPVGS